MTVTVKRISLYLTQEDLRQLNELARVFGETPNIVLKRAIQHLYEAYLHEKTKEI